MSFTKAHYQAIATAAWRRAFPDRPNDADSLEVIVEVVAKMRRMRPTCVAVELSDEPFEQARGFAYLEIWTGMYRVFAKFRRSNES